MTSRRSRLFRSSSLGEVGLYNDFQQIDTLHKPNWAKKPKLAPKQPERPVFMIGAPVQYADKERFDDLDERFGVFFHACNLCNKVFGQRDDIYMYSYLGAYCSVKCRDKQISLDAKNNKLPDTSIVSQTFCSSTNVALPKLQKQAESEKFPIQVKKKPLIATSFKYV